MLGVWVSSKTGATKTTVATKSLPSEPVVLTVARLPPTATVSRPVLGLMMGSVPSLLISVKLWPIAASKLFTSVSVSVAPLLRSTVPSTTNWS